MTSRTRRLWVWLHKWLGLATAAVMLLVALTGSILVFWRELDAALNPDLYKAATGPGISVASALAAASAAAPAPVTSLRAPDPVWPVWVAYSRVGEGTSAVFYTTHVDPGTGMVLGTRNYTRALVPTIYSLHYTLLLRPWWGMEMVGALGLILLFSTASGLYLWWPRHGGVWRATVQVARRPRQRLYLDLHNVSGVWTALVLIVVAYSGIAMIFPGLTRATVAPFSEARPFPRPTLPGGVRLLAVDADRAVAIAAAEVAPSMRLASIAPPVAPGGVWRVGFKDEGADTASGARNFVWLDQQTGAVVERRTYAAMSSGERFLMAQYSIHNGGYLGWPGRIAIFASGIALTVLTLTGVLLWLRKRAARRSLARRRDAAMAAAD